MTNSTPKKVNVGAITVAVLLPVMLVLLLSNRSCPNALPVMYNVVPSDINGKLEYCVGLYQPGWKMQSASTIVQKGATCGADKAPLIKLADSMSKESAAEVKACFDRTTQESLIELYHRWFG